jgi:hypothetical protein
MGKAFKIPKKEFKESKVFAHRIASVLDNEPLNATKFSLIFMTVLLTLVQQVKQKQSKQKAEEYIDLTELVVTEFFKDLRKQL